MNITRSLILTGSVLLCFQWSFSQAICGFDAVHNKKMKEDAGYRKNVLAGENSIRTYIQQHPRLSASPKTIVLGQPGAPTTLGSPPYNIPVVVHIMHTGGAIGSIYNPTDAQILGAIDYLNKVYNGTDPTLSGGAGDLQIQFVLAQRDPNCNPTNGINRVDASSVPGYVSGGVQAQQTSVGTQDVNVKDLSRWDPTQYYNIWVVNKIDGVDGNTFGSFVAGFAYFPGSPADVDGIIMLATQMVAGQKTLPHEIGHAFNLYHPFENPADPSSATCAVNTSCSTQGDQVCDTDPVTIPANFTCRTGTTNTCTGGLYSINTESNYMNYTDCYTLFTAGQKARMLASAALSPRLSLTTSQGGMAPGAGSSPCAIPKIDFELSDDQVTETTAASSGCRAYKDYTYNMVIGSNPSAAATATLNKSSGTAVQGLDFDFTTNGNFSSPSNTLNFPAASAAAQPFTIRVYDDASVNGTRSLGLGFSVNNGGGNAAAGNGRPNLNLVINDNDAGPAPASFSKSVGTDWGAVQSPFVGGVAASKSQFLYYASELQATGMKSGKITGLSLNIDKVSGSAFTYQGMTIKLAQTTDNSIYTPAVETPLPEGAFTTVYSAGYITTNGWNDFTFSAPFTWNGTSNLVVEICYDNGVTTDATDQCEGYVDGSGKINYTFSNINCGATISSLDAYYNSGIKPMARFAYDFPGAVVESTQSSSVQQYLGPNTDLWFYDQTNGQLMARIQNLSSFDYGCTQVTIDRAGLSATQFWNNNTANYLMDKTFHVLPTTNNPAGNYTITLYYAKGETDGWQTATGQFLSDIKLVKLSGQISSVTPAAPTAGGTVLTVTPVISSLGANTGLSYSFTNGFSGFGAGVPGSSVLPIGLLNFEGQLENGNASLDWTTSFEQGSKEFTVGRSYDGSHFEDIGYVAAAGNSASPRKYSFTDPSLTQENNYYRLRQSDLDGRFTYSKVILIKNNAASEKAFTVLSNPFTDQLDILFGHAPAGSLQIRLLDMTGKEVLRQSAEQHGNLLHIDLSGRRLSAGAYLLEIRSNDKTFTGKLLKR